MSSPYSDNLPPPAFSVSVLGLFCLLSFGQQQRPFQKYPFEFEEFCWWIHLTPIGKTTEPATLQQDKRPTEDGPGVFCPGWVFGQKIYWDQRIKTITIWNILFHMVRLNKIDCLKWESYFVKHGNWIFILIQFKQ